MALFDQWFLAPEPRQIGPGWWFVVDGQHERRYGPFPTERDAAARRMDLFRRWNAAARARGGWAWKQTADKWVVTLPVGQPMVGRPFDSAPCSVAS